MSFQATFMHKKQLDANTFGVVFYRYKAKSEACCGTETYGVRRGSEFCLTLAKALE
jgi:hypothetical protein